MPPITTLLYVLFYKTDIKKSPLLHPCIYDLILWRLQSFCSVLNIASLRNFNKICQHLVFEGGVQN